ncbi:conserved hypothetical protein [Hyella patelloides LEGE 07179]|uniref:Uncharacterized protein n=1 Tax=Hyella patelloides LEGE 07179 TaxID=945734 RepID=A0A563VZU6_9CYAN|nr:hypothetical protein [Hyella patelloides]VEP16961.1 conserved hypothetical protein [Hyella patelloides LEGE 07179]
MTLLYTKSQTDLIRQKAIDKYVLPIVKKVFAKYPQINSASFAVAQYWDDNAYDEVHNFILYSVLDIPDWEAYSKSENEKELGDYKNWDDYFDNAIKDPINLPGITEYQDEIDREAWEELEKEPNFYYWNGLGDDEIAAFAAFCKEGSNQCMDYSEAYTPYAILTRTDNSIAVEIVGKMLRPWLDGVRPERDW